MLGVIKRVGEKAKMYSVENELECLQKTVGGYIETVTYALGGLVILCDEEGRLKNRPYNCTLCGVDFYGDILAVRSDLESGDFKSLKHDEIKFVIDVLS